MKCHYNSITIESNTVGGPLHLYAIWLIFNLIVLELSKMKLFHFQDFHILTYEISKTTEPIDLKFSGIREGINKLAVFKVSEQSNKFEENCRNMEFWEISTIGILYGLVRTRFTH